MNKAELVVALEGKLGGKKAASDALDAVLDAIIREAVSYTHLDVYKRQGE